jgi:hypothetical protein
MAPSDQRNKLAQTDRARLTAPRRDQLTCTVPPYGRKMCGLPGIGEGRTARHDPPIGARRRPVARFFPDPLIMWGRAGPTKVRWAGRALLPGEALRQARCSERFGRRALRLVMLPRGGRPSQGRRPRLRLRAPGPSSACSPGQRNADRHGLAGLRARERSHPHWASRAGGHGVVVGVRAACGTRVGSSGASYLSKPVSGSWTARSKLIVRRLRWLFSHVDPGQ